jgi:hypothetical protein
MGFSSQQFKKEQEQRPWKINPVWRGIGCFLILLIPIMAWFSAQLFMQSGVRVIDSPELTKPIVIRQVHIPQIDAVIKQFNQFSASQHLVGGQFFYFILFLIVGFGVLAFLYAVLYRMAGPPRYGPFDVPPNSMRR